MRAVQKIIVISISAFFAVMSLAGVFLIQGINHQETGCPFMQGEQSMCPMSLSDHISAWQKMFVGVVSSVVGVVLAIVASLFFLKENYFSVLKTLAPPGILHAFRYFLLPSAYQDLFSNGILNPKIP